MILFIADYIDVHAARTHTAQLLLSFIWMLARAISTFFAPIRWHIVAVWLFKRFIRIRRKRRTRIHFLIHHATNELN